MAEIVNLRQARKRVARREAEAVADRNRVDHGLPKHVKDAARRETADAEKRLDGRRLMTKPTISDPKS